MSQKELFKEELKLIMELTGEPFVRSITIRQMLILSAGNSIHDLALLAGQVLKIFLISDKLIFLMVSKNQFS
jgi:hypothetical protein